MTDTDKQQRFIQLRAEGWSFARIAQDLGVSKPTLIKWSRKYRFEIQNHRAILMEQLQEQWLSEHSTRVAALGEQLRKVELELSTRDISGLTTSQLFNLAASLRRQIKGETGGTPKFAEPVSQIPNDEFIGEVQDWQA